MVFVKMELVNVFLNGQGRFVKNEVCVEHKYTHNELQNVDIVIIMEFVLLMNLVFVKLVGKDVIAKSKNVRFV